MKALDKIYVHITPHLGLLEATAIPVNAPGEQVYIRKDALIEWLLKGIEMSEICHSEYGDACAQAYQAVIDKLNSM